MDTATAAGLQHVERVDALAGDHLVDHLDDALVAWMAVANPNKEGS
jgi:hypothetical protein